MGFKTTPVGGLPTLALAPGVVARPLDFDDTAAVFHAVEKNRRYLSRWMPFEHRSTNLEDTRAWIGTRPHFVAERGVTLGIFDGDRVAGIISLLVDRPGDDGAHLGYWVDEDCQGKGWVTRTVSAACEYAFANGVERIVIEADVDNQRSRAIAERLGFHTEGIARSRLWHRGEYRDHAVYAVLARDWVGAGSNRRGRSLKATRKSDRPARPVR